ncbi:hypothetical protein Q3G72_008923 [Acer saccharum]|nr:hypothetical protein Q3G72_008923 [Acer saccharum]
MDPMTEAFCFSAQQTPRCVDSDGLGVDLGSGGNTKRARADNDTMGRSDFVTENPRKEAMDGNNNASGKRNGDVRNGAVGNANANGSTSNSSGSRFEILNEEVEANSIEETMIPISNYQEGNTTNVKGTLAEITNINKIQNTKTGKGSKKVTRKTDRLGIKKIGVQGECSYFKSTMNMVVNSQDQYSPVPDKESAEQNNEFEGKSGTRMDSDPIQGKLSIPEMNIDNRFVAVASNLEEAMATITE